MSEEATPSRSLVPPALRLSLGRHRVAARLAFALVALAAAGPLARVGANILATSTIVGGLLDALSSLLSATASLLLLSATACVFALYRLHPATNVKYAAALATAPWRPGRPLPAGDVSLLSTFALLPALALAAVALMNAHAAGRIAAGAGIGYAGFALAIALLAQRELLAWLLLTLLIAVATATYFDEWTIAVTLAVAILIVSSIVLQSAVTLAWSGGVLDLRRLQLNRRSTLGWFENLPLENKPRQWATSAAIALGVGVASFCTVGTFKEARSLRAGITTWLLIGTSMRIVATLSFAPLAYGLRARLMTVRPFVPRMDRLLLPLAVMLVWLLVIRWFPWPDWSPWNPVLAGAFVGGAVLILAWLSPTRLEWQTTGASRINLVANKTQRQAEVNLRKWSGN